VVRCPKCQSELAPGSPPQTDQAPEPVPELPPLPRLSPGVEGGDLAVVETFHTEHEARLALSLLLVHGIVASVAQDSCGATDPGLGFGTRVRLLVPESQLAEAAELLRGAGSSSRVLRRKVGS
jgi:hypothetical protein